MTKTIYPASLLCDMYKLSHRVQYPENTTKIYSTFTPRSNKYSPRADKVVVFGVQAFVKKYLMDYFNTHFFERDKEEIIEEYARFIKYTLGNERPYTAHIGSLHDLGYLPVKIKALKEGSLAPMQVPVLTIENTAPEFFWVTNFLETIMSSEVWMPMTSATTAKVYRDILDKYAMKTVGNTEDVDLQAHDFSMRSMSSFSSAVTSGAAHLTSFLGSDTASSALYLEEYYNANMEEESILLSIPATEHSVQSANTSADYRDEYEFFKRLITEVYPDGFVSVVSDTYDYFKVLGETIPRLKKEIMNRNGKIVIRPDSSDPVKILVGDPEGETEIERKGTVETLWDIFSGTVNEKGYKVLDSHIGVIYGDSMTHDRVEEICQKLEEKGFASTNVVLGIGGYSYHYSTSRDTFGFAVKATYAMIDGEEKMLFKDPKTDPGKRSQRGMVAVVNVDGELHYEDNLNQKQYDSNFADIDQLEVIFEDGKLMRDETLKEIRERLKNSTKYQ